MDTLLPRLRLHASNRPLHGWLLVLLLALAPLARAAPLHVIVVPYCAADGGAHHDPAAPHQLLLAFALDAAAIDHSPGTPPPTPGCCALLPAATSIAPAPALPLRRAARRYAPAPPRAPPSILT